jgi:hypothetical protein
MSRARCVVAIGGLSPSALCRELLPPHRLSNRLIAGPAASVVRQTGNWAVNGAPGGRLVPQAAELTTRMAVGRLFGRQADNLTVGRTPSRPLVRQADNRSGMGGAEGYGPGWAR